MKEEAVQLRLKVTMTKKCLLFLLFALSSCNYQPKHVEFEPYVSPEEINLRLEKIKVSLKNTPRDNTLRLDYAEACIKKLEYNYLMDVNTPYPGPASSRVYQDLLLTKSIDSDLGVVLSEDSLSERALSLRFRNWLRYPIFSTWPPYYSLRIGAWPNYIEDTIPKTISALLRSRSSSTRGLNRYASVFDFQNCDFSREDAVRLCYNDFEQTGEMLHELGRARWARTEGRRKDPRVLFDLWALKYGVERRTSYVIPIDFLLSGFDTDAFLWGYHEVVKKFPSIAQFIFFKDMSARIITGLKKNENEKYVMIPLRQLIQENPKLCRVYYDLILLSLRNKEFSTAIQWITQATKEVPNFALTRYPRNDVVSNALDTLRSLDPSIPSIQLDCLNRKYSVRRIFDFPASQDSLVDYLAELEKLESIWGNYWGHLEFKVRIMEYLIWGHSVKSLDTLDSRIWPGRNKNILSEYESCVFHLLRRYRETDYFPRLSVSLPMWFATHGFVARGKQLLQNLVRTAPQLTEEFLWPVYSVEGKSSKAALALLENLHLTDSSCQPLLWWIIGNAYLRMDGGGRVYTGDLESYYNLSWIRGTTSPEHNNTRRAIPFLERASREGQEQATEVLFDVHVKAKRYEKAIPLCEALANKSRRYSKIYHDYPYVGWWVHVAQKAYLLRKIGRGGESDSILTQLYASYPEEYAVYYGHALSLSEEQKFSEGLHVIELGLEKGRNPDWAKNNMMALRDSIVANMRK